MTVDVTLDGLDDLLRAIGTLQRRSAKKVATAALRGGLKVIENQMKKDVSSKVKEGRKGIKSRIKTRRGQVTAKVGIGVGKRKKKSLTKPLYKQERKRPGVGIGPRNISWWVAGTKERTTGRRPTGRTPAMQSKLAYLAAQKGKGKIHTEMIKRGALALKKERATL